MNDVQVGELRGVIAWYAQVREDALTVGPEVAAQADDTLDEYVRDHPRARSVGALQHALDVANRELHHAPLRARVLTTFVLRHMEGTTGPEGSDVPLLLFKARAWREHANALQATGDLAGAFEAVHRAAEILKTNGACGFDRAIAQMSEAHIASERGENAYALGVIRETLQTFEESHDLKRSVQARIFEGMFEFRLHNRRRAAQIFASVLPAAAELRSARELALVYNNLWQCALELDDDELARQSYAQAEELFAAYEMDTERPRLRWGYGRYLARRGKQEQALAEFTRARASFEALGMPLAAAAASLDAVHTLHALGRTSEARTLCKSLVPTFLATGILPSAVEALAYLQTHADHLDVEIITRVRDFLERLEEDPQQKFTAPHA